MKIGHTSRDGLSHMRFERDGRLSKYEWDTLLPLSCIGALHSGSLSE